jgi:hypothetical protein
MDWPNNSIAITRSVNKMAAKPQPPMVNSMSASREKGMPLANGSCLWVNMGQHSLSAGSTFCVNLGGWLVVGLWLCRLSILIVHPWSPVVSSRAHHQTGHSLAVRPPHSPGRPSCESDPHQTSSHTSMYPHRTSMSCTVLDEF